MKGTFRADLKSLHLVSLVALAGAACPPAWALNLKGRVLDKAGMAGVPGATIKAGGLVTSTDSLGRFTLAGSTGLHPHGLGAMAEPFIRDGFLFLESASAGKPAAAAVEIFGVSGERLAPTAHPALRDGWNGIPLPALRDRDGVGFARITLDGRARVMAFFQGRDAARAAWLSPERAADPLAKASSGNVEVTAAGLLAKAVPYASDDQDLGNIVLDYPPRKLGVGAPPIYGALVLFDGSKGRAAAAAELSGKWTDWPRFTPSDVKFNLARDPQFPSDTNRVTLQSCCNTTWGYDDIQAKVGLYRDFQLHIEWIGMGEYDTPKDAPLPNADAGSPSGPGAAGYVNSGVYVASRYEVQIQSFATDPAKIPGSHDMGAIVDAYTPLSNQNKPNGEWQAYDITYRDARWNGKAMASNPYMTVWWNGVVVHDNRKVVAGASGLANHSGEEFMDSTVYGLKLQSEGRDVRFRNVWIRKLDLAEAQTKLGY